MKLETENIMMMMANNTQCTKANILCHTIIVKIYMYIIMATNLLGSGLDFCCLIINLQKKYGKKCINDDNLNIR